MFAMKKLPGSPMLAVAALVMILVAAAFPGVSEPGRANDAWSERLTSQAEHVQREAQATRAANAWSQRLNGLTEFEQGAVGMSDRAVAAWADRLTGLAEFEQGAGGMSDRAIAAWADRLSGLAEYYAAQK